MESVTRDRLLYGSLEVSPSFIKMENPKRALCKSFSNVQDFKNGELDVKDLRVTFPKGIQCLRIAIGTKQKSWVAITEVAVFTEDDQDRESRSTLISATLKVYQSKDKVK